MSRYPYIVRDTDPRPRRSAGVRVFDRSQAKPTGFMETIRPVIVGGGLEQRAITTYNIIKSDNAATVYANTRSPLAPTGAVVTHRVLAKFAGPVSSGGKVILAVWELSGTTFTFALNGTVLSSGTNAGLTTAAITSDYDAAAVTYATTPTFTSQVAALSVSETNAGSPAVISADAAMSSAIGVSTGTSPTAWAVSVIRPSGTIYGAALSLALSSSVAAAATGSLTVLGCTAYLLRDA